MAIADGPVSRLYYFLDKKRRHLLRERLTFITKNKSTPKQNSAIIQKSFADLIKLQIETFYFPQMTPQNISDTTQIINRQHLDNALKQGTGVILLNSHFGNFQMVIAALGHRGYSIYQMAVRIEEDPEKFIHNDKLLSKIHVRTIQARQRLEESLPVQFLHVQKFMRTTFRILKNNDVLIIAGDGRQGTSFSSIPFMNTPANFSTGPFELALRTGAVIVPTITIRQPDNSHHIHMFPHITPDKNISHDAAIQQALSRYITILEEHLHRYPDQYLQFLCRCIQLLRDDEQPLFKSDIRNNQIKW